MRGRGGQDIEWGRIGSRTLALVLAGGSGTRLGALTRWHCKPALPFGGIYRNIDFTLSNCVNSGLRRVAVLTQYRAQSLIEHLQEGWSFLPRQLDEFIEAWPAQQRVNGEWYGGTADAVHQNADQIHRLGAEHVLILAGDHVYAMDYGPMFRRHASTGADLTVACVSVPAREARELGVLEAGDGGDVTSFVEKPGPEALPVRGGYALASMGVYLFRTDFLLELLAGERRNPCPARDFGRDVLPAALLEGHVIAHRFTDAEGRPGYWRDVGTIHSYWRAHMDLTLPKPPLDLGDPAWPVWTRPLHLPPARIVQGGSRTSGSVRNAILSAGCTVTDAVVRHSVLSTGVTIEAGAVVEQSVLLPDVVVERGACVHRAIVAPGVRIPQGAFVGESELDDERGEVTLVHEWRQRDPVTAETGANAAAPAC